MSLKLMSRRSLVIVPDPVEDPHDPRAFYDATIDGLWPLAVVLYDGDADAAARAVVRAYHRTWLGGARTPAALAAALFGDARPASGARRGVGNVVPLRPRTAERPGRAAPAPAPGPAPA